MHVVFDRCVPPLAASAYCVSVSYSVPTKVRSMIAISFRRRALIGLTILLIACAAAVYSVPTLRERFVGLVALGGKSGGAKGKHSDEHGGHDHAGHEHAGHSELNAIELSKQAQENI